MKRILPAMCIVFLIVSCAGSPAAPDETGDSPLQEVSSETGNDQPVEEAGTTPGSPQEADSLPSDETNTVQSGNDSVIADTPAAEPILPLPDESAVDYVYPEPELQVPDSVPPAVNSGETAVAPSRPVEPPNNAPGAVAPRPPAVPRPPVSAKTEPVRPAKPDSVAAKPEPVQPAKPDSVVVENEEDLQEKPDIGESGPDPVPEVWPDDPRSSEPPPPVVRPDIVPSRTVTVPRDGILEVWYPGTGWVYLGDASGLVGVSYDTRKIENRDTLFTFRARRPGNYILEFSRYDVLTDDFMQDALSVTVVDPVPGKRTTVRAPDFVLGGSPEQPSESGEETVTSMYVQDEPVLSAPVPENRAPPEQDVEKDPEEMLVEVQSLLASGDAPAAMALLDRFFEKARDRLDEGWYLRGQAYEANSVVRNIRKALEAYETVVSAYPDSIRWKEADERIRYIKQFYFRVR